MLYYLQLVFYVVFALPYLKITVCSSAIDYS